MRKLLLGIVMSFNIIMVCAQDNLEEAATDSVTAIYNKQRGTALPIFNGRQFIGYSHLIEGFPYYLSSDYQQGSVKYEGVWYHNLSLMYDAYMDQVILKSPNGFPFIALSERLQEFNFAGQHFVRVDEEVNGKVKPGFYHRMTSGNASLLVKRTKKLEERIDGSEVLRKFYVSDRFYILKNNTLKEIGKQKDLFDVLKDKKQEVQNYLKNQDLKFKSNPELTIIKAVEFYNQSNK